ncbi:MAG: putative rane protein [Thermodesulfobacteriota bacterium]|jgi:putative membrane protein|nr:putative rane protein [Thermodesulfobacteriota bacterium]
MPGILIRWIIMTVTVLLISKLHLVNVTVDDTASALVFAAILGVMNAFIRPVLIILTLPLTLVTLGFFVLVLNALLFWFVAGLDVGVHVAGFWSAFGASLIVSLVSWFTSSAVSGGGGERTVIVTNWDRNVVDLRQGRGGKWE